MTAGAEGHRGLKALFWFSLPISGDKPGPLRSKFWRVDFAYQLKTCYFEGRKCLSAGLIGNSCLNLID